MFTLALHNVSCQGCEKKILGTVTKWLIDNLKLSTEGYISNFDLYSQSTIGIPQMSSILPYDIIVKIIDTVGEESCNISALFQPLV